jgi:hypothetical protein
VIRRLIDEYPITFWWLLIALYISLVIGVLL